MTVSLAGGASTQSRARRPLPPGAIGAVTLAVRGARELVEFHYPGRADRRWLLSWVGGQSGLLFGGLALDVGATHSASVPDEIADAVAESTGDAHGSYGHRAEYDLAEALGEAVGGIFESGVLACRFGMNGSDVCAMAVRIARRATGRDPIASSGYHGHSDCLAHPPALGGIPLAVSRLHRRFEFGDVDGMRAAAVGAACVMVEAPAWDDEHAVAGFLAECRKECDQQHIPLIIDDIVCGVRLALGGSPERYGVHCDLLALGKAMSALGGISAIIGDAALVNLLADKVFYSGTFFGSPGSCRVAAATLRWLTQHRAEVYGPEGHLQVIGRALKDGLNALGISCVGQPERSVLCFPTEDERHAFCSRMIAKGVMMDRPQFSNLSHTMSDVEKTLEVANKIINCNVRPPREGEGYGRHKKCRNYDRSKR